MLTDAGLLQKSSKQEATTGNGQAVDVQCTNCTRRARHLGLSVVQICLNNTKLLNRLV